LGIGAVGDLSVGVQRGQRDFDLDIAFVNLGAVEVVELKRLAERKHMFDPVVAVERLADSLHRRLAAPVAMLGE